MPQLIKRLFTGKNVLALVLFHGIMFFGIYIYTQSPYLIVEIIPLENNKVLVISVKEDGTKESRVEQVDPEEGKDWTTDIPGVDFRKNFLKIHAMGQDHYYNIRNDILVYNNLFIGDYRQFAIDLQNGKLLWENRTLPEEGERLHEGSITFGDRQSIYTFFNAQKDGRASTRIIAQDRRTGKKIFEKIVYEGRSYIAEPIQTKDHIYMLSYEHKQKGKTLENAGYIIGKKDGAVTRVASRRPASMGTIEENKLYYTKQAEGKDLLYNIDLKTMKEQFLSTVKVKPGPGLETSYGTRYKNMILFYEDQTENLHAIGLKTGKERWKIEWKEGFVPRVSYQYKERYIPVILEKKKNINESDYEDPDKDIKLAIVDGETGTLLKEGTPAEYNGLDKIKGYVSYKDGLYYIIIRYNDKSTLMLFDPAAGKFLSAIQVISEHFMVYPQSILFPYDQVGIQQIKNRKMYLSYENELTVVDLLAGKVIYGNKDLKVHSVLPGVLKEYGLE
ncbi:MAG: hypothetical protein GY754_35700 [bacterium]|nr:hypothetical protein [bacterium]